MKTQPGWCSQPMCPQLIHSTQQSTELAQVKLGCIQLVNNCTFWWEYISLLCIKVHFVMLASISTYTCWKSFTVKQALSCQFGGFPSFLHNETMTWQLVFISWQTFATRSQTSNPSQESLFCSASANMEDDALSADGFWCSIRMHMFLMSESLAIQLLPKS